jgi:hypothetical protein
MTTIELSVLPVEVAAKLRAGVVFTDQGRPVLMATKIGPQLTPETLTDLANAFDAGAPLKELARAHGLSRFALVDALAATGRDPYRYEPTELA